MYQQIDKNTVATFKFINLDGSEFELDVVEALAFDEHSLHQATFTQASNYAWWATILADARRQFKSQSTALDLLEAQLGNRARAVISATGAKPTKDMVHDYVLEQPEYVEAREAYDWWDNRVFQLTYVIKAWEQRGQALIQAGAQYRKDMDSYNIK